MPSFDIISEADLQEVRNAVDQANREIGTRFDFKGIKAGFELGGDEVSLHAEQEFQLGQMLDILHQKLVKRGVDLDALAADDPVTSLNAARQRIGIKQGIDGETAKRMTKMLKAAKLKIQIQVQGDQVRVTGKKRDDLQQVIMLVKQADWERPLQFVNFRD